MVSGRSDVYKAPGREWSTYAGSQVVSFRPGAGEGVGVASRWRLDLRRELFQVVVLEAKQGHNLSLWSYKSLGQE